MINRIFEWAWIHGIDVRLTSQSYDIPVMGQFRNNPRREAPNYVDTEQMVTEIPVLTFSRGDLHEQISAVNWAAMVHALEFKHTHIFAKLCCKPMPKAVKC